MSVKEKALLSYEVVVQMFTAEYSGNTCTGCGRSGSYLRKLWQDLGIVAQAAEVLQEVAEQDCDMVSSVLEAFGVIMWT